MRKIAIKFVVSIENGSHWIRHPIRNYVMHTLIRWLVPVSSMCARRNHGIYFHIGILKMNRSKICYWKQINRQRMHYVCVLPNSRADNTFRTRAPQLNTAERNHMKIIAHTIHSQYMVYFVGFIATLTNFHLPFDSECVCAQYHRPKPEYQKNWAQMLFFCLPLLLSLTLFIVPECAVMYAARV